MIGVDVSAYQNKPNWSAAKLIVDFAILRVANSKGLDTSFEYNYENCGNCGIRRGVYRYSYATTVDKAIKEAQEVLKILNHRPLEMGVWFDFEWKGQRNLGKNTLTSIAQAFIKTIKDEGYKCGIYCNIDWYNNVLDTDSLSANPFWIARYPGNDTGEVNTKYKPSLNEVGWQYSSKGRVPGIDGNVDMDIFYAEIEDFYSPFTSMIKKIDKETVKSLQSALRQQGITGLSKTQLDIDGVIGKNTTAAIKKSTMHTGSRGYVVQWLKMRLDTVFGDVLNASFGYTLTGGKVPSNIYDERTEKAVAMYQSYNGLKVDGIAGINTIRSLLYQVVRR